MDLTNQPAPRALSSGNAPHGASVRLLHASDLHLERVVSGLAEVPTHLRDLLIDVPYAAASRVFETALAENVDAVLLAGDVVDLAVAGPRAVVFLRERFEELAARGIRVFWAGGRSDPPHAWPKVAPLPPNVHVFSAEQVESFEIHRDGELLASVVGISDGGGNSPSPADFMPHAQGVFTIGVAYGRFSREDLEQQLVPYFAAGGRHWRKSLAAAGKTRVLHYPGAPQGASPREAGPHGATLLTCDAEGAVRRRSIATDVVRWETPQIEIDGAVDATELERRLATQAEALRSAASDVHLLVRWQLGGSGPLIQSLRQGDARQRIVKMLRDRFGQQPPYLWTTDVDVARESHLPLSYLEEETILGDVLREIRKLREEPPGALALAAYVTEAQRSGGLFHRLMQLAPERHEALLDETSDQCVALLSGKPA